MTRGTWGDVAARLTYRQRAGVRVWVALAVIMLLALLSSMPGLHSAIGLDAIHAMDEGAIVFMASTPKAFFACAIALAIHLSGLCGATGRAIRRFGQTAVPKSTRPLRASRVRRDCRTLPRGLARASDDEHDSHYLTQQTFIPAPGFSARLPGVLLWAGTSGARVAAIDEREGVAGSVSGGWFAGALAC